VELARQAVGDYPILIKVNATDYVPGGTDLESFPELAHGLVECGVDALEISGGMWDCLVRREADLGFRPVPSPEAHTGIGKPSEQSYFLPYAQRVSLGIPLILVGGNRDVELLERIVRAGKVDFVGMCRPFLAEPGLAGRWLAGDGASGTTCVSCNSCLYWMYGDPRLARPRDPVCVYLRDAAAHARAQQWLSEWVHSNLRPDWQRGS
jgi:2,4-dienoyl-CoA reductase-like NADH-dependent reductase (Old Yellow Enzyme family)